jgi:hypothetical protein
VGQHRGVGPKQASGWYLRGSVSDRFGIRGSESDKFGSYLLCFMLATGMKRLVHKYLQHPLPCPVCGGPELRAGTQVVLWRGSHQVGQSLDSQSTHGLKYQLKV